MITLLQAAQPAGGGFGMWGMIIIMIVIMYFFMIRPQQKQQKELKKFREGLKKGDKVVTVGGIFGTVLEVKDNVVFIEIDNNVKIKVAKNSLVKDFAEAQQ